MSRVRCTVLAMVLMVSSLAGAQGMERDSVALLKQYMCEVTDTAINGVVAHHVEGKDILSGDSKLVLPELQKYENHSDARVRCDAWVFEWAFAVRDMDIGTRRAVVGRMAKACNDTDLAVVTAVTDRLLCMDKDDFNDEARDAIRGIMASGHPDGKVVALCGVADMRDEIPRLRAMLVDETKLEPSMRYQAFWRARLALARMGSQTDITQCIKVVKSEPDPVRRVTMLLRHLAFTRQPEVIPVLQGYLDSEERFPSEDDVVGLPYSKYALDVLARTHQAFPVEHDRALGYKQAEIDTAREWMKTHDRFVFKKRVVDPPLL
jgi:hypothetical protein